MKKVKYEQLVKELFETDLSSDVEEDKYCKKLVANVNFGLLEKGQNKVQKSKIFNILEEVRDITRKPIEVKYQSLRHFTRKS